MQDSGSSIRSRCRGAVSRRDVLKYAASAPVLLSLPTVPLVGAPTAGAVSSDAGKIVFLDPGHNGANDSSINRQVVNGRGGAQGMPNHRHNHGRRYPKHSFNWDTVLRIRTAVGPVAGVRYGPFARQRQRLGPLCGSAHSDGQRPAALMQS